MSPTASWVIPLQSLAQRSPSTRGVAPMSRAGFIARNVRGLSLEGVQVSGQEGEAFVLTDVA